MNEACSAGIASLKKLLQVNATSFQLHIIAFSLHYIHIYSYTFLLDKASTNQNYDCGNGRLDGGILSLNSET